MTSLHIAKDKYTVFLDERDAKEVSLVGGKNASLAEMIQALQIYEIKVPGGFAVTTVAYDAFIESNELLKVIVDLLEPIDNKPWLLEKNAELIRKEILKGAFPKDLEEDILDAYKKLSAKYGKTHLDVAARSSANLEDLKDASFAGQQESYLHLSSAKDVLASIKKCFASLFTARAISYRIEKKFDHAKAKLSVGVQKMVRSDVASSGVMFSIDTETGFPDVVVINASYGLGENIVQGLVNPDEYLVYKPLMGKKDVFPIVEKTLGSKEEKLIYAKNRLKNMATPLKEQRVFALSDEQILELAKYAITIEKHYKIPMDMEFAIDGISKEIFIVQARPETVQSQKERGVFFSYHIKDKPKPLLQGVAIGESVVAGRAQVIKKVEDIRDFKEGSILVTTMTDPDWVPIMKKAKAIITENGGRTSHAAIVSRELGLPAIVGTGNATDIIKHEKDITVSCEEGNIGSIYEGLLEIERTEVELSTLPKINTDILLNLASPQEAYRWWRLPVKGIGLARIEFIISDLIRVHPLALIHFDTIEKKSVKNEIDFLTSGYNDKTEYFVEKLASGIAKIASLKYPQQAIVRMSDFKTNEYANLIGGEEFEPKEENPMLGFRGACRYYSDLYKPGFLLECAAVKRARDVLGFDNIKVMIPFCRTLEEADKVLEILSQNGLSKNEGVEVYIMCEIPSNVILADEFAKKFSGFSIGSNDLTQLVLGVDRDSKELAHIFDERNEAVQKTICQLLDVAHKNKCKVGICGQAPSDYPEFAQFLVKNKIDSISLNPDSVLGIIDYLGKNET